MFTNKSGRTDLFNPQFKAGRVEVLNLTT